AELRFGRAGTHDVRQPAGPVLMRWLSMLATANQRWRWFARLVGTLCVSCPIWAHAASVLFITTDNVPKGKFQALQEIARPHDIDVQVRYLEELPAQVDAGVFSGHDIVFIDSYQVDKVRGRLVSALDDVPVPLAWLYEKAVR